jgi:hypothetical protein
VLAFLNTKKEDFNMSRRIVTKQLHAAGATAKVDTYFEKLIKYIPADVVGAWITAKGLIDAANGPNHILWIAFSIGVILTFIWTLFWTREPNSKPAITQTILSTISFVIWVIAMGDLPFDMNPLYGSLLLIFYSLIIARVNPPES